MDIDIIEVGPRDGLQNEQKPIPTGVKIEYIRNLISSGLKEIEITSFVSPKWVPQLSDAESIVHQLKNELDHASIKYHVLIPNKKGLAKAYQYNISRIALFTTTSDAFSMKNMNAPVENIIQEYSELIPEFRRNVPASWIRIYLSNCFECPFTGKVDPCKTLEVSKRLIDLGVDDLVMSDTTGVATPDEVGNMLELMLTALPASQISCHFHDTYGMAIANVARSIQLGVRRFDSSSGGLGGCPYAPGASGNLATEDLMYFLTRSGYKHGVDLEKIVWASENLLNSLGKRSSSKVHQVYLSSCYNQAA